MTSFVQKILVHFDRHEFAITQKREKDVFGTVTFDLIGLLPTKRPITLLYDNGIPQFLRKRCSNNEKLLTLYYRKVESTEEMANFGDYPGDFIL